MNVVTRRMPLDVLLILPPNSNYLEQTDSGKARRAALHQTKKTSTSSRERAPCRGKNVKTRGRGSTRRSMSVILALHLVQADNFAPKGKRTVVSPSRASPGVAFTGGIFARTLPSI
ncbi:unnamed protein product, partial [Laminaria digitata]